MSFKLLAVAFALTVAVPATAATPVEVVSGTGQRSGGLFASGPLGQSFIANGTALTSFGFQFTQLNAGAVAQPITFTLREGGGLEGRVLFTRDFAVTASFTGRAPSWQDFALGGVEVAAGGTYTALVSATNNRLGLVYGPNVNLSTGQPIAGAGDAYAGGRFFSTGTQIGGAICQGSASICDANFRFTAATAPAVPEPATWAMMIGGFGLVGGALRRSRRQPAF